MEMILIYPVFIFISLAVAQLARQRGYSGLWWFVIATLLPIISIFMVLLLKKKIKTNHRPEPNWAKQKLPNDKILYSSNGIDNITG